MGAFEDFVNANLGVRMPLFIDTTTPSNSSIAAGSLGSKFVDSSTSFLYEKTGYTNADWVKIAELGETRGGGGGGGMSFANFTGGLNIKISGDSTLMYIETNQNLSGSGFFFTHSGIIGTGDGMPFVVSESGQVGLNLYTTDDQTTGYITPFHLHVSGATVLSGERDIQGGVKPALTVMGETINYGNITATGTWDTDPPGSGKIQSLLVSATVVSGTNYRGDNLDLQENATVRGTTTSKGNTDIGESPSSALGSLTVYGRQGADIGDFPSDKGAVRINSGVYLSFLNDTERNSLSLHREGSGLMIFNRQHSEFQVHDGSAWAKIVTGAIST